MPPEVLVSLWGAVSPGIWDQDEHRERQLGQGGRGGKAAAGTLVGQGELPQQSVHRNSLGSIPSSRFTALKPAL